jgi:hypothetical protein
VRRLALLGVVVLAACPGTRGAGARLGGGLEGGATGAPEVKAVEIAHDERTIEVPLENGAKAELGALLVHPRDGKGPAILIVPGASDVSRKGTRAGDGVTRYAQPVDVYSEWADAFAKRGANILLWDKRTCGPNDDPMCKKNSRDDIDAEGPVALAKDVDAACALAKSEPSVDGRIVLFAHAQAAQVALSSACAKDAAAIVLVAPIPRAIDEVIVAGLKDRTK